VTSHPVWPDVLRVSWLTGGVVAINEPGPKIHLIAGLNGATIQTFEISSYSSLYESLQLQGFQIMGTTFVVDLHLPDEDRRHEFRTFFRNKGWLAWEVKHKWRRIAVAAGIAKNLPLMDVASRIASGITYTESRLSDLVNAYSLQLSALLRYEGPKQYEAFKHYTSLEVYKGIHALFWEMAVLRDTLAEFAARFCFSEPAIFSMKGLRKTLKKLAVKDQIADEILRINQSSGGWLATFTAYRNCFTHLASLEQVEGTTFVVQDMRRVSESLSIPQVYYPLPGEIEKLLEKRSRGFPFASLEEFREALSRHHDRNFEPDALEYLHSCATRFAEFADELVSRSPVPPQPIHIGPKDIIGEVRVMSR